VIFLGIDGGGSKTAFLLEDQAGRRLARIETGPSNWLSAGPEVSRQSLAAGISQLPATPDVVCGGFAGAGRPEGRNFYGAALSELLPRARVFVETDAFVAYAGAIGVKPGVLLIAGTGSIAVSRQADGTMNRTGGWGPVFGDEGSGFWIGREAVRAALSAHDDGASPAFAAAVANALGQSSIVDVVGAWTAGAITVRSVASLSSLVLDHYPQEPAARILRESAAQLRSLVERAIARSGLPAGCAKSIAGSIGSHPALRQLIGLEFEAPAEPPERGAIEWARARITPA
jgi:N-acetylglucosamine kinase-like BadF-type ATPase